jgi:hypothetical protein
MLGLCLLYRFLVRKECFPSVLEGRGRSYKWLPLAINTERMGELDEKNALLALRGVDSKAQNAAFNLLYAIAGVDMVKGDSVTHVGRAAAQEEAEDAGLDAHIVNEALGYQNKSAKKEHYTPQLPLAFLLQRAGFCFQPDNRYIADAAHLAALRANGLLMRDLVSRLLPDLAKQERLVAAASAAQEAADAAAAATGRDAVMRQKAANAKLGVREASHFLQTVRACLSLAIGCAAARPRDRHGRIMENEPSLLEAHRKGPIYGQLRFKDTDALVFDDAAFKELSVAVISAEDREGRGGGLVSPSSRSQARAVAAELQPALNSIASAVSAVARDAGSVQAETRTLAREVEGVKDIATSERDERLLREYYEDRRTLDQLPPHLQLKVGGDPESYDRASLLGCLVFDSEVEKARAYEAIGMPLRPPTLKPKMKRKRRDDGPGLSQVPFSALADVPALWREYVGEHGAGGLRRREEGWMRGNKQSRQLFTDKSFFYREIVRLRAALGCLVQAVEATQQRLQGKKTSRSPGWTALLKELEMEQEIGAVRDGLNRKLEELFRAPS